jgi:fatty acid desaturase
MKREQLPIYALALAVLVVGLAWVGVPVGTLLFGLVLLACPLMMMFMMGGMHGGGHDSHTDHPDHHGHDEHPLSGPR